VNRVKVGFFSLSGSSETGDDRPYLDWHQLDHMPEQYQLPGMVQGQRWAATARCREVTAVALDQWALVRHVVCYLMGDPVDETIDGFLTLGRHLAELGRFSQSLPSHYRGALRLLEAHAAPRVLISPEVVPFRPHLGVYLIVAESAGRPAEDAHRQRMHTEVLPTLASTPGVAGAWSYATTPAVHRPMFSGGDYQMTLCYLDADPATVGERLGPVVRDAWATAPGRLVLAAPFESMMRWDWDRFGPSA
jgi:hypothetical protein